MPAAADSFGSLKCCSTTFAFSHFAFGKTGSVPAEVVSELTRSGSYAAVGSVGVLTEATSYTVGSCVRDSDGNVAALIFVSCEDPATAGVVRHSTQTLVLILLVTLAAMLIISFILSQHITRPIKNIAAAAKEFASGNFDVRVPEDNHCRCGKRRSSARR